MRCRYLEDGQCKNKATVWYHSIGICDEHKELLTKIIESKGSTAEFVVIPPKGKSIAQLVNMFEDTDPLHVVADIEKRQAIMRILEKHNPRMFYEWVASKHDSPRGYFLHGKAATAKRRRTKQATK